MADLMLPTFLFISRDFLAIAIYVYMELDWHHQDHCGVFQMSVWRPEALLCAQRQK